MNRSPLECLFCSNTLDKSTKPEHILPSALGGRKTTKLVLCSKCNGHFGSTVDRYLADQVAVLRNMFQMPSGTGNSPPGVRSINSGDGTVSLRPDGKPQVRQKPFEVNEQVDGTFKVSFNVSSIEELNKHVPNVAAMIGTTPERLWEQLDGQEGKQISIYPDPYHFKLHAGGEDAIRSMTKSCLVLLACLVGNDRVRQDTFAAARNFVANGCPSFNTTRTAMDTRQLPETERDALIEEFGPLFNLIYLKSDTKGRTLGYFVLYNIFAWKIVLSEGGGPSNVAAALVSNPLEPSKWSDEIADKLSLDFNWIDNPEDNNLADTQARLSAMMEKHTELSRKRTVSTTIEEVLSKYYQRDEMMGTDERWPLAIAEIADKLSRTLLRVPNEQPFIIKP